MFENIYEVERNDYKVFIETLKPECRIIKTEKTDKELITYVYRKDTEELFCARISFIDEDSLEKYYIFQFPTSEETLPRVIRQQVVLDDIKQVQALFDFLAKQKEEEND